MELHNATPAKFDFFILFSSYNVIVGQWVQTNYGAANTFIDSLVQYRHLQGQSASVAEVS